ncbi:MAG: hypothetical protein QF760_00945 [Candidatus Thalassarchaeaceae archaeon]|jgi:hypothetical protein|nr:hypothetical protein [Candidatus Thalassarchaeaceae archaeon]MDP7003920.1 hypothetical protein [Candidatus Thalassarchaeaceae archaeon]
MSGVEGVSRVSRGPAHLTLLLTALLVLPLFSPLSSVNGEVRIESKDFDVLDQLGDMLTERQEILDSNSVSTLAQPRIDAVREAAGPSDHSNPLSMVGSAIEGATMAETSPPKPVHPAPYEMLIDPSSRPPGFVENIWQTLFNITDYVIWTQYTNSSGEVIEQVEVVSFSASLLSLFDLQTEPLLHAIDIDDDGDDDLQVGLKISWEFAGGWGIAGDTLWIEPGIVFSVQVLEGSMNDPDWDDLDSLQVSIIKAMSYSGTDSILALGEGESYIWVIDSRFTTVPYDFEFEVGIERFYFDISSAGLDLISILTLGIFNTGTDEVIESGIKFAAISSPYSLRMENSGQSDCPDRYNSSELHSKPSIEISCGVSVGFGYLHLSPPDENENRNLWELAYLEARFHPHGDSDVIPRSAEVVIRTDSVLPTTTGMEGERSLTTIEYWADERSDMHIHFHENRSNLPPSESDGAFGNVTDSLGWFRGMPEGSMSDNDIRRIFRMLGSADNPELPGGLPENLGLIIGIKNFTRDTSQNVDDPTLPVNPAYPPNSLVILRSAQSLESVDYTSWFTRGGLEEDHRRIRIVARSIPTAIAVFGSFGLGDSGESDTSLDSTDNLDFFSKIMDSVIFNIVDLFLDVGNVLNEIPSSMVEVISGGMGSGSLDGRSFHLLLTDNWRASRSLTPIQSINLQIGSSDHPIVPGNHIVLAQDRRLNSIQTDHGPVDPLVPVAASILLSGLQAFSLVDSDISDEQSLSFDTRSNESLALTFINHDSGRINGSSHQSILLSDLPDNISISITPNGMEYTASTPIDTIVYTGVEGMQRQAARISGFPSTFTTTSGNSFSWTSSSPITEIESQLSNSSSPLSMSGDHFLFHHDPSSDTSTLSMRISGLREVGWMPPQEEGASGSAGRGSAFATIDGSNSLKINVGSAPTSEHSPLTVIAEIDPLPSRVSLEIPTGSQSGPSLAIPQLNASSGVSGIAFFISGFADLGQSVNSVLAGITTDISTGSGSGEDGFSFGLGMEADTDFDLVVESSMGSQAIDYPDWVHGISLNSVPSGISDGFHLRIWIPNLPPTIDLSVSRTATMNGQSWAISLGLDGWKPQHPEMIFVYRGVNGQDLFVTLKGLEQGSSTSLLLDSVFNIETVGGITEISTSTLFGMSTRLDWFHALLIDREAGSRTEMMVQDLPESVEIQASLGTAVSIDMTVPEQYRTDGFGVGSIMLQQMQWMDGLWWPATMFLTEVPGSMNLTTEPDLNFDITQNIAFQGMPILDFSASREGMSLYIEALGRAINSRGDFVLLAEGMSDRLAIKPTTSYGLNIRSGGDGVDRLYIRATNIPTMPPIVLEEMEALGENLKSATIHIREVIGPYSIIQIEEVQGGRIVVSARASATIENRDFDLRAVLLDAQTTGGVPSGTTLGVNGLASDLSILNMIPGISGTTSHIMAPEPLSSGILTLVATLWGDG